MSRDAKQTFDFDIDIILDKLDAEHETDNTGKPSMLWISQHYYVIFFY